MRWPYDRRVESAHAWGTISTGLLIILAMPTVLATLRSSDRHYRWWWPTDWMFAPLAIFTLGLVLLTVPVLRSDSKMTATDAPMPSESGTSVGQTQETPTTRTGEPEVQHRGALVVRILDISWELWRRRLLIVTLRAKVTNTTDKIVRLEVARLVGDEGSGYLDWLKDDKISPADKAALAIGCFSKCTLTGNTEVGPYADLVGVFCGPVSRTTPFGGTPALTFAVHDVIGNQYTARIEEQSPKVFPSPEGSA